ncbi:hypothetical protein [Nostoc sphaeroides]|uniref:Uncharacterized protein n=1 Tax=Nostoc sphaeroides CCNUC1 TaxID=2653204 RepID=A0A5P8WCC9_9NOSO|nr:hypothetical protein [Nostoc sphaeroides]QFS50465.1 hypothetical protein GXM_07959 [Nostoc sphaeroides CCNUC1]
MAFIKVDNMIINTTYIAAVRLEGQDAFGEEKVSLLIAIPTFPLNQQEKTSTASTNFYQYEWVEFHGFAAIALQDYFSSFNNVIDLMPQNNRPVLSNSKEYLGS